MRNPKEAGDRFARNSIAFAIIVLVIVILFYSYSHYFTSDSSTTNSLVPSKPAAETPVNTLSSTVCQPGDISPKALNPIGDYDIIADNVAIITSAATFDGKHLTFGLIAKPTDPQNKISIDAKTGVIRVQAEAKDRFDVTITAKNPCGSATSTFNIVIDEEE